MSKEEMLEVLGCVLHKASPEKVLKKKILDDNILWSSATCPTCGTFLVEERRQRYCHNCGQQLDWR